MKSGLIYKAVSPSGKVYIGKTTKTLHYRKSRHYSNAFNKNNKTYNLAISRAIRKYNYNIKWIILHSNVSEDELCKLEKAEIKKYNSFHTGYNSTEGGEGISGWSHLKQSLEKISRKSKGRKHSIESRRKISEANKGNNNMLGKRHSKETRKIISIANSGTNNGRAKLTFQLAQKIREEYSTGKHTHKTLATKYNVGQTTIGNVINNLVWIK